MEIKTEEIFERHEERFRPVEDIASAINPALQNGGLAYRMSIMTHDSTFRQMWLGGSLPADYLMKLAEDNKIPFKLPDEKVLELKEKLKARLKEIEESRINELIQRRISLESLYEQFGEGTVLFYKGRNGFEYTNDVSHVLSNAPKSRNIGYINVGIAEDIKDGKVAGLKLDWNAGEIEYDYLRMLTGFKDEIKPKPRAIKKKVGLEKVVNSVSLGSGTENAKGRAEKEKSNEPDYLGEGKAEMPEGIMSREDLDYSPAVYAVAREKMRNAYKIDTKIGPAELLKRLNVRPSKAYSDHGPVPIYVFLDQDGHYRRTSSPWIAIGGTDSLDKFILALIPHVNGRVTYSLEKYTKRKLEENLTRQI